MERHGVKVVRLTFTNQEVQSVPDRKYRVLVSLQRADRPRYWAFKCPNCGHKVGEIAGREIYGIDDFYDPYDASITGYGTFCKGNEADGRPCPYFYFFNLQ